MDEQVKVDLLLVSFFGGTGMMIAGGIVNGCLGAVGVSSTSCDWAGNPLGTAIQFGGFGLVAVGLWAVFYRRPPKTEEKEPFVPDKDGFYPLRNQDE